VDRQDELATTSEAPEHSPLARLVAAVLTLGPRDRERVAWESESGGFDFETWLWPLALEPPEESHSVGGIFAALPFAGGPTGESVEGESASGGFDFGGWLGVKDPADLDPEPEAPDAETPPNDPTDGFGVGSFSSCEAGSMDRLAAFALFTASAVAVALTLASTAGIITLAVAQTQVPAPVTGPPTLALTATASPTPTALPAATPSATPAPTATPTLTPNPDGGIGGPSSATTRANCAKSAAFDRDPRPVRVSLLVLSHTRPRPAASLLGDVANGREGAAKPALLEAEVRAH
jgi:hypothetical protein